MTAYVPVARGRWRNPQVTRYRTAATDASSRVARRVCVVWSLLFVNVLSYGDGPTIVHIPSTVARALLQGALVVALLVALSVNPRGLVRPSAYLLILTLLAGDGLAIAFQSEFVVGSTYRALRLATFVAVLWLLSPFWGHPRRLLFRYHVRILGVVLGSVALGAMVAPGRAFSFEGRLGGVIWPIPATQVAHYAAVAVGIVVILWLGGRPTTRFGIIAVLAGTALLVLTHTRTALMAMLAGILVGGLSLFVGRARVRKAFATAAVVGSLAAVAYAPVLGDWLRRGQNGAGVTDLTGRTKVWDALLAAPRPAIHRFFGYGLSNKSFNGLPIDSSWLSTYQDLGFAGIALIVLALLVLIAGALSRPRSTERALVFFLVTYSIIASITETGLGDATPYLLDLTVAASLLVPARGQVQRPPVPAPLYP